jgi:hypothetical protein
MLLAAAARRQFAECYPDQFRQGLVACWCCTRAMYSLASLSCQLPENQPPMHP